MRIKILRCLGSTGEIIRERVPYQLVKNAAVELLLGPAALEKVVVVVLEALPVRGELLQAVGVDVLDTGTSQRWALFGWLLHEGNRAKIKDGITYTLAAQRVTFRPSFKHSISPRPFASSLHFM